MMSEKEFIEFGFDVALVRDFFSAISYVDIDNISATQFNNILRMNLNCINDKYRRILVYMYKMFTGIITIDISNTELLCKHLSYINSHLDKVTLHDLETSYSKTGISIPHYLVVGGLKDTDFAIYDKEFLNERGKYYIKDSKSKENLLKYRYLGVFTLTKQTQTKCWFRTKLKPILKFKAAREIENKIGIEKINKDGSVDVWVSKNNCKLLNRYVIYASLKRPEFYVKMLEIITRNGIKIYLYAQNLYTKKLNSYNSNNLRIYGYGIYGDEIDNKLKTVYTKLQSKLPIYKAELVDGNTEFDTITYED